MTETQKSITEAQNKISKLQNLIKIISTNEKLVQDFDKLAVCFDKGDIRTDSELIEMLEFIFGKNTNIACEFFGMFLPTYREKTIDTIHKKTEDLKHV